MAYYGSRFGLISLINDGESIHLRVLIFGVYTYVEDLDGLEAVLHLIGHGENGLGKSQFVLFLVRVLKLLKVLLHFDIYYLIMSILRNPV